MNTVLGKFRHTAENTVKDISNGQEANVDQFIDYSSAVHDTVREIRTALLMNRDPNDIDSDEDYEGDISFHITITIKSFTEGSTGTGHSGKQAAEEAARAAAEAQQQGNQRAIMRQLPEEDKKKIQEQIDVFKVKYSKQKSLISSILFRSGCANEIRARGGQVGRDGQRHCCLGQVHVHDHDGDD